MVKAFALLVFVVIVVAPLRLTLPEPVPNEPLPDMAKLPLAWVKPVIALSEPELTIKPLIVSVAVAALMAPLAVREVMPLRAPADETSKFVELIVSALLPPPRLIAPLPLSEKLPLVCANPVMPLRLPVLIIRPLIVLVAVAAVIAPLALIVVIPLKAPADDTSKFVESMVSALDPPPKVIAPEPVTENVPDV